MAKRTIMADSFHMSNVANAAMSVLSCIPSCMLSTGIQPSCAMMAASFCGGSHQLAKARLLCVHAEGCSKCGMSVHRDV